MKQIVISVLLFLSSSIAMAQNTQGKVRFYLSQGDNFMRSDITQAITYYTNALNLDPSSAEATMKRARALSISGRYSEAQNDYNNAIKLNPDTDYLYDERSKIKLLAKDYNGALDDIEMALKISPLNTLYLERKAEASLEQDSVKVCVLHFQTLMLKDSIDFMLPLKLSYAYLVSGKIDSATLWVDKVLQKQPNDCYSNDLKGIIALENRDFNTAVSYFNKSIENCKNFDIAYFNRAIAYKYLNDTTAYYKDLNKAIELNENNFLAYILEGDKSLNDNKFEDAIQYYTIALDKGDNTGDAYLGRGYSKKMLGNFGDAITDIKLSIQEKNNDPNAYKLLGNVYVISGDYMSAKEAYDKAISLNPDYAEAYFNRGVLSMMRYRYDEGCEDLKTSLSLGYKNAKKKIDTYCNR